VQQVLWRTAFRESTRVLDKRVPRSCQLPIKQKGGLASQISRAPLSEPVNDALSLAAGFEEAILQLKAARRDDNAGVRNRRTISLSRALKSLTL
jgi:hypothetical protein